MDTKRLLISGRVQGVGYRAWLVENARRLGVDGWVRNRADGSVEALVSGDVASVEELLRACRRGPRMAEVMTIEEDWADPPEEPGVSTGEVRKALLLEKEAKLFYPCCIALRAPRP